MSDHPTRPVDAIANRFVEEYCTLDPNAATELGVPRDAFVERLTLAVERHDAGALESEISVTTSVPHETRMVFDLMGTDGEEAWALVDARLAAVPDVLGYRRTLTRARLS